MINDKYVIAVDFDGTLCVDNFPNIGKQSRQQKKLLNTLIKLQKKGHKLILWTNRGDNEKHKCLTEAIEWCKEKGLSFDAINQNLKEVEQKKISGYSPKIMADFYIDDKALQFNTEESVKNTLVTIDNLFKK